MSRFPSTVFSKDSAINKSALIRHSDTDVPALILRRFLRPLSSLHFYALLMLAILAQAHLHVVDGFDIWIPLPVALQVHVPSNQKKI